MVPLDRPRLGPKPLYVLKFVNFILNFWKEFKVLYCLIQSPSNPLIPWASGLYVPKPPSFSTNRSPKMRELHILGLEDALGSPNRTGMAACASLWRIFSSNKMTLANKKKDFYTSRLPKELGDWYHSQADLIWPDGPFKYPSACNFIYSILYCICKYGRKWYGILGNMKYIKIVKIGCKK